MDAANRASRARSDGDAGTVVAMSEEWRAVAKVGAVKPGDVIAVEVDGVEMVRRFRENPATAQTPIIILSGREEPEIKTEVLAAGANDYLVPQTGTTTGMTPYFTWKPIAGKQSYYVLVARDPSFSNIVDYAFTHVPHLLAYYYWHPGSRSRTR